MTDFIRIEPTRERRVAFARWAVAQNPKIRTVSPQAFAVPADLFTGLPEELLIGATVDGHRYVSPTEDEQAGPDGGPELLGVFQPEREGTVGEALPELPEEAYPPDAQPLDVHPAEDESDRSDRNSKDDRPECADCGRPFKSDRALAAHRRQAHPED
ncbi:hypothetical protein ABZ923_34460 [Streptomyces sp. NPDC046881]|uniref:hypothetical protein n=1 Tax=Streptomyces sp. NPDC046881 TaxID=3155374 RepID=UPI0033C068FD